MKTLSILLTAVLLLGCAGCKDCNKTNNPTSKDYPCGTRAHACSMTPLSCCWNDEVCGGPAGSGCPAGMCCFVGDNEMASPSAMPSAAPGAKMSAQWEFGTR